MQKLLFSLFLSFAAAAAMAQTAEISQDDFGNKVIKGFMTQNDLAKDSAFGWFAENQKDYTPEAGAVQAFRTAKDSIHILAFGGTWCSDTKYIFPRFFAITEAAGLSPDQITLLGVDRDKKTIHHLAEAFDVVNVPTLIILKNGKEVGRVVEYGKTGMFDKELGQILTGKQGK